MITIERRTEADGWRFRCSTHRGWSVATTADVPIGAPMESVTAHVRIAHNAPDAVGYCSWCPNPQHPDPAAHPGRTRSHHGAAAPRCRVEVKRGKVYRAQCTLPAGHSGGHTDAQITARCPHGWPGGRHCGPCSFDAIAPAAAVQREG